MAKLNPGLGSDDEANSGIEFAWRDSLFNKYMVILQVMFLLLFVVHPPKENDQAPATIETPGNVIVEMVWDKDRDIDLDLWVQAPGDTPVGYSAKSGKVFDLLRDDLGKQSDLTDVNMETAFSRGIPAGEYCVNVHAYRMDSKGPVEVVIAVRIKGGPLASDPKGGSTNGVRELVATKLTMKGNGQELTAFRFKLTKEGQLIEGSLNHIFKPLRSQGSSSSGPSDSPDQD